MAKFLLNSKVGALPLCELDINGMSNLLLRHGICPPDDLMEPEGNSVP